jgi:hypothetical protein
MNCSRGNSDQYRSSDRGNVFDNQPEVIDTDVSNFAKTEAGRETTIGMAAKLMNSNITIVS